MSDHLESLFRCLTGGDDEVAEKAVQDIVAISALQPVEVLQGVDVLLNNPLADHRWWALRIVAEISGEQTLSRLMAGLRDPEAAVRQCAALGLRKHPYEKSLTILIETLSDADRLVAQLARDALIAMGKDATLALVDTLQNGSQTARLEAVRALAMIGDERAIPALFNALDSESRWIEYWASLGLERMGVGMSFFLPE
jgi:serine/threonine-protein kinase